MRCSSSSSRVRSFWSWLTTDCISVFGMKQSYHSELDPRRFLRKVLVNWRNIAIPLIDGVCKVSGNGVADDLVPTHVICREPKRGPHMRVQRDAAPVRYQ